MTKAVANLATSDSFNTWFTKTNQLLDSLTNEMVTVSTTGFGNTTGNGYVNGIFGSATLVANTSLRGGNVTVSNTLFVNSAMSVVNNVIVSGKIQAGNSTSNVTIVSNVVSIATVTPTVVDSYPTTEGKIAKWVVSMQNAANTLIYAVELMGIFDAGGTAYLSKYGEIYNSSILGTFDTAINGANLELKVTAIDTTTYTVKAARIQM